MLIPLYQYIVPLLSLLKLPTKLSHIIQTTILSGLHNSCHVHPLRQHSCLHNRVVHVHINCATRLTASVKILFIHNNITIQRLISQYVVDISFCMTIYSYIKGFINIQNEIIKLSIIIKTTFPKPYTLLVI